MTPMIDVVFLLIVFFLVSSHLAQRENRIKVELPTAVSGQGPDDDASKRVTITLQSDGQLWLAGRLIGLDRLTKRLTDYRSPAAQDSVELRIRCDRSVPYRQVEPLLGAAVDAGIWDVSFAVLESSKSTEGSTP